MSHAEIMQGSLAAGFKGGWRAAMETLAEQFEQALTHIEKAGEDPAEYAVNVRDVLAAVRGQADHAPTPGIVEMKTADEPLVEAEARAVVPPTPAEGTGIVPSAEESFPYLAAIIANSPPEPDTRRARARWVAALGFALFTRDCAAMDGRDVLDALDREGGRMRDLIVGIGLKKAAHP